jgi:hypothetical protein
MKQVLLSICITILAIGALNAQITISPNPQSATFNNVFLNGTADLESHVAITNTTNDTLRLKWLRVVPENCPAGWTTKVCDNSYCFNADQSSNYVPGTAVTVPFVLLPGETFSNFLLHVLPNTSPGCCEVKIHFSTINDPDNVFETLTYDVRVNDPNCTVSSTKEQALLSSVQAFPNPSTGEFSITDNPLVKTIEVYNLLGRRVHTFAHVNGKVHNISDVPDGLYLVSMQNANGEVLKTVRITKQDLRP